MKCLMKRDAKILTIFGILAATAVLSLFWANVNIFPFSAHQPEGQRPPRTIPGDIELYYTLKTVISTLNVALLIILLLTYVDIYVKTKSEFTIGLIIFSIVLFLDVIASNPLIHWVFGFYAFGLGPFAMLPDLFTFFALVALLYLTIKY